MLVRYCSNQILHEFEQATVWWRASDCWLGLYAVTGNHRVGVATGGRPGARPRWRLALEDTPVYTIDEVHQQLKHHDKLRNRRRPNVAVLTSTMLSRALLAVRLLLLLLVPAPTYGIAYGVEQGYEMLVAGEGLKWQRGIRGALIGSHVCSLCDVADDAYQGIGIFQHPIYLGRQHGQRRPPWPGQMPHRANGPLAERHQLREEADGEVIGRVAQLAIVGIVAAFAVVVARGSHLQRRRGYRSHQRWRSGRQRQRLEILRPPPEAKVAKDAALVSRYLGQVPCSGFHPASAPASPALDEQPSKVWLEARHVRAVDARFVLVRREIAAFSPWCLSSAKTGLPFHP